MHKKKTESTHKSKLNAVLIGLYTKSSEKTKEYLEELAFLASTAGIHTKHTFTQRLDTPDRRTFVGKGKLEDILAYCKDNDIQLLIFDEELSPLQVRNLEQACDEKEIASRVWDRSLLILDIFVKRAQTVQAKTQVELAQYQYMLPRLTRLWTHLSKQRGGVGMRGPGEKELETDKRIINDRIAFLKEKLKKIDIQSTLKRKNREGKPRVALVGYTNVGKSTLLNRLAKDNVFAENKLFATVDSTVRSVFWKEKDFLLTDTVGFIRKLPTTLIEAFKSTLDEVREADILLHVVDISHESFEEQMEVVHKTLIEIGADKQVMILVFNKIDKFNPTQDTEEREDFTTKIQQTLSLLQRSYLNRETPPTVFISAENNENITELKDKIIEEISKIL